jgi:hypothetical protein
MSAMKTVGRMLAAWREVTRIEKNREERVK